MSPGAYTTDIWSARSNTQRGVLAAAIIAIVFLTMSAASFALDQNVTLSCFGKLTATHLIRH
jgi:hypothetical protein